jgi:hypothetical protein
MSELENRKGFQALCQGGATPMLLADDSRRFRDATLLPADCSPSG